MIILEEPISQFPEVDLPIGSLNLIEIAEMQIVE